jgi:hypothetical protein
MTIKNLLLALSLILSVNCFAQNSITEITTEKGIRYLTTKIDYPIEGTYNFKGTQPNIILNSGGTGTYQFHDLTTRNIIWGIECFKEGTPVYKKGFDNRKYYLFYKYTADGDAGGEEIWNKVDLTVHLNSGKIFINGERSKSFTP